MLFFHNNTPSIQIGDIFVTYGDKYITISMNCQEKIYLGHYKILNLTLLRLNFKVANYFSKLGIPNGGQ